MIQNTLYTGSKNGLSRVIKSVSLAAVVAGALCAGSCLFSSGASLNEYLKGNKEVMIYENGVEKKVSLPIYSLFSVPPSHCSKYSRLVTESFGNKINPGNAWDLALNNPSGEYNSETLQQGDLVLFYNPSSKYQIENREGSHVAVYLGKNKENDSVYAEQRGICSRVTSSKQFCKEGWTPKRIIFPTKNNGML